jgi:hypothetical protein
MKKINSGTAIAASKEKLPFNDCFPAQGEDGRDALAVFPDARRGFLLFESV